MLINKLKEENKKIFILGINNASINLINFFLKNDILNISLWDTNKKIVEELQNNNYNNKIILEDINKIDFSKIDYIILNKNILLDKCDKINLIKKLDNVKEKVFILIEFLKELFPNNKFIGISGKTYKTITVSIIEHIISNSKINIVNISPAEEENNYSFKEINLSIENSIFITETFDYNYKYFKNMSFDFLAILDNQDKNIGESLSKNNIISNQLKTSTIIVNIDSENIKEIYENISENKNFCGELIQISTVKMLDKGFSFINGTIYNYYNTNSSYDFIETETLKNNTKKTCALCSYVICYLLNINSNFIFEYIKLFKGQNGYLEFIKQVNNIKFVNNVFADNDYCLIEPFENYSNVYPIFVINEKQNNIKEFEKFKRLSKIAFIIDKYNLYDIKEKYKTIKINKYSNLKLAMLELYKIISKEDKSKDITVLLTPIISDNNNVVYYSDYSEEFKNVINNL